MSAEVGTDVTAEVRELAAKTAADLRRRGRTTGTLAETIAPFNLDDCRVCPLGGIAAAAYGDPFRGYTMAGVALRLAEIVADRVNPGRLPGGYHLAKAIWEWNDGIENEDNPPTDDDVLAVFDQIAAAA
jgi:hypothetical protein